MYLYVLKDDINQNGSRITVLFLDCPQTFEDILGNDHQKGLANWIQNNVLKTTLYKVPYYFSISLLYEQLTDPKENLVEKIGPTSNDY